MPYALLHQQTEFNEPTAASRYCTYPQALLSFKTPSKDTTDHGIIGSQGPRRGPFRSINTLTSSQKPKFTPSAGNKATLTPHTQSSGSEADSDSLPRAAKLVATEICGYESRWQAVDKESSEGDNRGDSIIGDSSSLFEEEHTKPLGVCPLLA